VRDTWEITPDHVTLGGHAWEATLAAVLDGVRDELGLPPTTKLQAELHAMLVYGKGQFFLPHQDSEKDDAMVGTLVVSLPSAHTGGELAVEHCGESVTYRASKEHLSFVAFYADCRHEVKPVKSGHRVTLTLNLLADGGTDTREPGRPSTWRVASRSISPRTPCDTTAAPTWTRRTGSSTCSTTSTPSGA
jgi:hypothetical protein